MFQPKPLNSEAIVDGGELSPLTVEEQATILKALQKSSREYQLILRSLQVHVCKRLVLYESSVYSNEADSHGFIRLPVGVGTGVDTKFQKPMTLLIPHWLTQDIKIYINSDQARQRRQKVELW